MEISQLRFATNILTSHEQASIIHFDMFGFEIRFNYDEKYFTDIEQWKAEIVSITDIDGNEAVVADEVLETCYQFLVAHNEEETRLLNQQSEIDL